MCILPLGANCSSSAYNPLSHVLPRKSRQPGRPPAHRRRRLRGCDGLLRGRDGPNFSNALRALEPYFIPCTRRPVMPPALVAYSCMRRVTSVSLQPVSLIASSPHRPRRDSDASLGARQKRRQPHHAQDALPPLARPRAALTGRRRPLSVRAGGGPSLPGLQPYRLRRTKCLSR